MVSAPEDDFTSFLDFGELNFPAFDSIPQTDVDLQQQNGDGGMDVAMEGPVDMLELGNGQLQHQMGQHSAAPSLNGFQSSAGSFTDLALHSEILEHQRRQQNQMQNQRYHAQHSIPPTPNSMEMNGGHGHYYRTPAEQQQLHVYDHYRRMQKEQVSILSSEAQKS